MMIERSCTAVMHIYTLRYKFPKRQRHVRTMVKLEMYDCQAGDDANEIVDWNLEGTHMAHDEQRRRSSRSGH